MLLSVVIPMYNESKNVRRAINELTEAMRGFGEDFEILFSDDGSTDGCAGIVSEHTQSHPEIRLLCHPENRGKGAAVREGMLSARGEYIVFTDCDLAYGTKSVTDIFAALRLGENDIVIGSRTLTTDGYGGYSELRKFISKNYLTLIKTVSGFSHTDSQCGIKGFTSEAAKRIFSLCRTDGFAFDLEALMLAEKLGYKVGEIPVCVLTHAQHTSKVKLIPDALSMLADIRKIKKRLKRDITVPVSPYNPDTSDTDENKGASDISDISDKKDT